LDEGNTRWQQDLATSLSKMGDFYLRLGDARKAEENYSEGLKINKNLAALDEENTSWQQDLATSLSKMGDFYLRLGDARKAEENYSEGLKIFRNLADLDEGNTRWQQDLATSLSKMGDFYLRLGDARKAEENYSEDLRISRNLAALDEGNTRWQQDLATSLSKMGDFLINHGNMDGFENFTEAKTIHEALLDKEPYNIQYLFDYALDFLRIGNILKMAQQENAMAVLISARDILADLCQKVPDEVNFKEHLEMVEVWLKEIKN
jgi:tetratricopeptide (TPR) repeat protein